MLGIGLLLLAIGLFLTRHFYPALFLFFGFVTNGYQLIPPAVLMAGAPTDKLTDLALVFLLVALISRGGTFWVAMQQEKVFRWVGLFVLFVAIDGVYSLVSEGYELGGVLRVFRVNLFLLSFGVFFVVPTATLVRMLHALAVITVIQCVVYLIQIPLNLALLNSALAGSEVATTSVDKFSFTRFYNTPVFLTPVVFYYLFQFRCRSTIIHWFVVGLLLLTVMAPLHRIYIFSFVVTASLYALFRQGRSQRAFYLVALFLIGYGVSLIDVVSYRLNEGFTDLAKTFDTSGSLATADYGENTFAYRMAHLSERVNHITEKPGGYLFGIGLLSEDSEQAGKLSFQAGSFDERIGRVAQINTGDIAWSLLILQLGFVGTILFVVMLIRIMRLFYRHPSAPFSTIGLLTLAVTFLISFAGTELLMIPFRTLLILMAVVVVKTTHRAPAVLTPVVLENSPAKRPLPVSAPTRLKIYTNDHA